MNTEKSEVKKENLKIVGFNKYLLVFATILLTFLNLGSTMLYRILSSFWMFVPAFIVSVIAFISIFLPIITYRYLKKHEKADEKELPRSYGVLMFF